VNFFIAYVLSHSVLAYMLILIRPFRLIIMGFGLCCAKSKRDVNKAYRREEFLYAYRLGPHMLIFLIVITYRCLFSSFRFRFPFLSSFFSLSWIVGSLQSFALFCI
jgi:hypothetical protein